MKRLLLFVITVMSTSVWALDSTTVVNKTGGIQLVTYSAWGCLGLSPYGVRACQTDAPNSGESSTYKWKWGQSKKQVLIRWKNKNLALDAKEKIVITDALIDQLVKQKKFTQ